jgi:Domain of unknown function (DUF397).
MDRSTELAWRKSSYSGGGSGSENCVEAAPIPGGVAVRDSKNPAGPRLEVGAAEWRAFLEQVRSGRVA